MKKVLLKTFAVAGCLSLLASVPAFAGWEKTDDGLWHYSNNGSYVTKAWKLDGGRWFYLNENGTLALSQFVSGDDGSLYYVDSDGQMVENGWINVGGAYYYAGNGGAILKNTTTPDGYYVDANGVWDQSVAQVQDKTLEQKVKENEQLQASLTNEQKQKIWNSIKSKTKLQLKYPNTAKFPEWNSEGIDYFVLIDKEDGQEKISVTGWCEAKNGFGNYCEVKFSGLAYRSGVVDFVYIYNN